MHIDRAGWPFLAVPLASATALTALGRATGRRGREPPASADVLAPADGVVMVAGEPQPDVAPEGDWQQVSIFLSVVDVHVNRSPYRGQVTSTSYRPGSFLAAYRKESAHRNERSEIWLRDGDRQVVFRQVVGVLARRIVTRVQAGEQLATGQRMGLMKFGSRMDVFVPPSCTVTVTEGQRVRGGETVIARWSGN
jgi:phosphatidylserine decarboxylase